MDPANFEIVRRPQSALVGCRKLVSSNSERRFVMDSKSALHEKLSNTNTAGLLSSKKSLLVVDTLSRCLEQADLGD